MDELIDDRLPLWAIGRANGKYRMGAQLPTKDGRNTGNAHIIGIFDGIHDKVVYQVLTDAGSKMMLNEAELQELFHEPKWISDVKDVIRKFERED